MSTITLCLPSLRRLSENPVLARGTLARWFGQGDRLSTLATGRSVWIRELFQFAGTSLPVAALTRQVDVGDASGHAWLRADPAHVRADMSTARMLACGELGITPEECRQLLVPLKPLFGDAGFPIDAPLPSRWYLRAPAGAKLPEFAAPDDVLGDDLKRHLPDGNTAARWRNLLNEAQIMLHNHPVNVERAERGAVTVNSLWFWGAGSLPEWVKTSLSRVCSTDPVLNALAQRARVAAVPAHRDSLADSPHTLLDLDDAAGLQQMATDWLPRIDALLSRGAIDALRLVFASGERVEVRSRHRWRFWRRTLPLAA